jgi:hypothetical protein
MVFNAIFPKIYEPSVLNCKYTVQVIFVVFFILLHVQYDKCDTFL